MVTINPNPKSRIREKHSAAASFDELFQAPKGERSVAGLKLIDRNRIVVESQPRKSFTQEERSELANSIRELRSRSEGIDGTGILQPLLVTPADGDRYRLIAGERRYHASGDAGVEELPVILVKVNPNNIRLLQLVENLQRQDLRPLEEAEGIQNLMSEQKLSIRDVANILGKKKGYVENRLNLLKMGADLKNMVSVRTDTLQHARLIDSITIQPLRKQLIEATMDGASERDIRRRIEKAAQNQDPTEQTHNEFPGMQPVANRPQMSGVGSSTFMDPQPPHADPLAQSIKPAVSLLAEGSRLLETMTLTDHYRKEMLREIQIAQEHINQIREAVK